jgi:hypothetical protein
VPANLQLIEEVLRSGDEDAVDALLNDEESVFGVDWREADDAIVEYCEAMLQTGTLSAEMVNVDGPPGWKLYITYKGNRGRVPHVVGPEDRHITILALNRMLSPDFEIRFCIASNGGDTLAFLPLASKDWAQLERQYGSAVAEHFYKIALKPNLFTDALDF